MIAAQGLPVHLECRVLNVSEFRLLGTRHVDRLNKRCYTGIPVTPASGGSVQCRTGFGSGGMTTFSLPAHPREP